MALGWFVSSRNTSLHFEEIERRIQRLESHRKGELTTELSRLESMLSNLKGRYAENHHSVLGTARQIEYLRNELKVGDRNPLNFVSTEYPPDNNVMHTKPDLRLFLKWTIAHSGSVITDVISLK